MNKWLTQKNAVFLSAFICLCYIVLFKPVIVSDGYGYIDIARMFAGLSNQSIDTSDRQPFYSLILSVFYLFLKEPALIKAVVVFQYVLIFLNSIVLYKIFLSIIKNNELVFFIPIAYLVSLGTIFYGYMILSETVACSLFLILVYLITRLPFNSKSYWYFGLVGLINSLLFLTRFSTFFIFILTPAVFCAYFIFIQKKHNPGYLVSRVLVFLIPVSISLFSLSYINLKRNNFFFFFPTAGTVTHYYSILSTIDTNNKVSSEYQVIDELFLKKKSDIEKEEVILNKGSLLNFIGKNKMQELTIGWKIYTSSEQELFDYYGLQGHDRNRAILTKHLSGFYKEIEKQNRRKLIDLRVSSLLMCLRPNNVTLSSDFANTNLNVLPSFILIAYKIISIILFGCFYLLSGFFIIQFIRFKNLEGFFTHLSIFLFVIYFPITGFLTADVYNITRYKFISEPLLIGLLFYYLSHLKNLPVHKGYIVTKGIH